MWLKWIPLVSEIKEQLLGSFTWNSFGHFYDREKERERVSGKEERPLILHEKTKRHFRDKKGLSDARDHQVWLLRSMFLPIISLCWLFIIEINLFLWSGCVSLSLFPICYNLFSIKIAENICFMPWRNKDIAEICRQKRSSFSFTFYYYIYF